jgi:hypothetical protein
MVGFEIWLIACNDCQRIEQQVNPFTGAGASFFGGCVTDEQREAIESLLERVDAVDLDEGNYYLTEFADGGEALIWFVEDEERGISGASITVRQLSPELASLLYALLRQGHLAICPERSDPDAKAIVTSEDAAREIAVRWPDARVVWSAAELHQWLAGLAAKAQENKKPWWKFW